MIPIIGDAVEGVISSTLGPLFSRLIDLIPDPVEKARQAAIIQQQLMAMDAAMITQQNAINLAEASNSSLFVSGGRPAAMWVCVSGLFWQVFVAPFLTFAFNALGYHPNFPVIDASYISMLLIPLLGLGAMKTTERLNGVSNEGQKPTQTIMVKPAQSLLSLPSAPVDKMQSMYTSGGGG